MLVLIQHIIMLIFKWFSFMFCYEFKISNSQNQLLSLPSFRAQREIFLALRAFLLPSQKVSPFPLSHIGRYASVPERSLDFARDDVTGVAFSQHIRCTLHEINPFPPCRHFEQSREIFLALHFFLLPSQKVSPFPRFLVPFAEGFPFPAITHTTLSPPARKIPRLRSG